MPSASPLVIGHSGARQRRRKLRRRAPSRQRGRARADDGELWLAQGRGLTAHIQHRRRVGGSADNSGG